METVYIKSNINKDISPKLFYPHELQQNGEIDILKTKSCNNLADLFTTSLLTSSFEKCGDWYATTQRFTRFRGRNPIDNKAIIKCYKFLLLFPSDLKEFYYSTDTHIFSSFLPYRNFWRSNTIH